jgi:3-methylcrotonyl-CoA carboxylase alpha subunit
MTKFSKILIANRGEISCRIIRTAQRMGIATVAVYSGADRDAAHVALADEAYAIGSAPALESYLDGSRIIAAAVASGAQAIHPGYGFLSENATFAEACAEAGIAFIGPPASAIRAMGGKSEAKALMAEAGVPLVPGYYGDDQSLDRLMAEAAKTGYPVLIKASAGGGGKGMRVAETRETFAAELSGAKREAIASFGDDRMLIEKYLVRPRHVEVQIFADNHGNCYSLFERDCSIQRRHQKVIEEAPAPGLSEELRKSMADAAISAARAINYSGAGTVEFLLDARGEFYFMEMNTRLQVEHPVTEFITGLDLVEWQFRVAAGEKLPTTWSDLSIHGHAIEARIYAEDSAHDFLPSTGTVTHLVMPEPGPNVRIDGGVRAGDTVTIHYDPMLAKLIVWDVDRLFAVRRLRKALESIAITGVTSNVEFLARLSRLPAFEAAELDTGFISQNAETLFAEPETDNIVVVMAGLGMLLKRKESAAEGRAASADPHSPWAGVSGFRLNGPAREVLRFVIDGHAIELPVMHDRNGYGFECDGARLRAEGKLDAEGRLSATVEGRKHSGFYFASGQAADLIIGGSHHRITMPDPMNTAIDNAAAGGLAAPMPGLIRSILVDVGERVEKGRALVVMEAMKMEHTIRAPADGVVLTLNCVVGAMTEAGVVLVEFEPEVG